MAQEYKLKDISSLDLKTGEKREVEVEGIDETKVLLLNVGGKTTALGSKCEFVSFCFYLEDANC